MKKSSKKGLFASKKMRLAAILAFCVVALTLAFSPKVNSIITYMKNLRAQGDTPAHSKTVTPNGDGTYKISLDVTGEAEKKAQKANVIVVFDTSSSMNRDTGNTEVTYTVSTDNGSTRYGLVNGEYVLLTRVDHGRWANPRYTYTYNGSDYTGTRYTRQEANQSRLQAAQQATNELAEALLANNGKDGNPTDTIQIALVDFANTAEIAQQPTTSLSSFESVVNNRNAGNNNRGTNWEAGFRTAQNVNFNDSDPTYVIFVSDGNPTYYMVDPGNTSRGGSGQETTDNINTSYEQAVPAAQAIVTSGKTLYTIGIYGNVDRMESITTAAGAPAGNYYSAEDTAALQAAFAQILEKIEMSGIGNAQIADGTTQNVTTSTGTMNMLTVADVSTFEYTITFPITDGKVMINTNEATVSGNTITWSNSKSLTGKVEGNNFIYTWTEANDLYDFAPPAATNVNSEVKWDLTQVGVLVNGATYRVSFDVWPSQETYDLIADLKNGKIQYSDVDANVRKYLSEDYVLKTNTGATLTYTDTRVPSTTTVGYTDPEGAPLESSEIKITKEWPNALDGRTAVDENGDPLVLDMYLIRDNVKTDNKITVSESNSWHDSKHIATGLLRTRATDSTSGTLEVLDPGHDYTLEEPEMISYHWELVIETSHPMIIDGTLTTLVEADIVPTDMASADNNTYKTIDGTTYYKFNNKVYVTKATGTEAQLTAYNYRKSYVEFNKVVTGDAPEGKEFNFSFQIHNEIGAYEIDDDVWFSVYDTKNKKTVKELTTSASPEYEEDEEGNPTEELTGYYYAANDSTITVKLQDGWNLRIINLGTGSTYTINETGIATEATTEALEASDPKYFKFEKIEVNTSLSEEEEYEPTINGTSISGSVVKPNTSYSITYTNDYPGTYLTVNKEWVGAEQTSVEVELFQTIEGEKTSTGKTATLNADNEWTYTFEGLALRTKDEPTKPITYSVEEATVNNYRTTYEQDSEDSHIWTITNIELVDVTITKEWNDANDQDGKRPETVTMTLSNNQTVTLSEENSWTTTLVGLDKYDENGNEITYTWTEEDLSGSGYTIESTTKTGNNTVIKNKHVPEVIDLNVTKTWEDADNQDGKRPTSIKVHLLANGTEVDSAVLTGDSWSHKFTEKPKYAEGEVITYTVTETDENDQPITTEYTLTSNTSTTGNDGNITLSLENTHTVDKTSICVKKAWEDDNNRDGLRKNVVVELYKNGVATGSTYELNDNNEWTVTLNDLDKYTSGAVGTLAKYAFKEITELQDYVVTYSTEIEEGINEGEITVTNTHEIYKTNISGTKTWVDNNNQDGKRPETVTFNLLKTVEGDTQSSIADSKTIDVSDSMEFSFENLPLYEEGKAITYEIEEVSVDGYTTAMTSAKDNDGNTTYTITNTHEIEKVSVSVTKAWDDNNNQDGKRVDVPVTLSADGTATDKKATLTENNNWTYTFENLDKYADGKEIAYTVDEDSVPEGYTKVVSGDMENGFTITNTHEIEKTTISVTKAWDDNNNQDGKRTNIDVTLSANGTATDNKATLSEDNNWTYTFENLDKYSEGKVIAYTVDEDSVPEGYTKVVSGDMENGFTITNTHEIEKVSVKVTKAWDDNNNQDGKRTNIDVTLSADGTVTDNKATLSEDNNWTYTFENLDKYADGKEIAYTVDEDTIPNGYTKEITGDMENGFTITNTHDIEKVNIKVTKAWDDNNNQDGKRVEVPVTLYADGKATSSKATLSEANNWTYTFEKLDKFVDGKEVAYTVDENSVPEGYSKVVSGDMENGFTITNTHEIEKVSVKVTKAWDDNNNQDGKRVNVPVTLSADGTATDNKATLSEDNNWTYTFENLDKYADGKEIAYTVDEDSVPEGYTKVVSGDMENGFTITNTHEIEKVSIKVTKSWSDNNNQDGLRVNVPVTLSADGTATSNKATLSEDNNWTYTFENLDKYANGKEIAYTVDEDSVPEGYEKAISGDMENGFTITNTHETAKITISGKKTWKDADDQDGKRPDSITVNLLADGDQVATATVTAKNNWEYQFTDLDKFANGKEITYTITEDAINGYETTISGYNITNTHEPELISLDVTKTWNDNENQDGKRPAQIIVHLLANGTEVDSATITEVDGAWTHKFTNKPRYANGEEITYTVTEDTVSEYETNIEGLAITNSHTIAKTNICVNKEWVDNDDQDGYRPEEVIINLLANGTKVQSEKLSQGNNWTYTFEELDVYQAGGEITYTITEDSVPEYTTEIEGNKTDGFVVTNTHTTEETTVSVEKVWDDNNDQDGKRPASITVNLMNEDKVVATETLSEENSWKVTFEHLDKKEKGKEITYTVQEVEVEDYVSEITGSQEEGYTVTNTHEIEKITVSGEKTWDNEKNIYGFATPTEITVNLYADGEKKDSITVTADENGDWKYSFENLDKYANGKEIAYTVDETAIRDYDTTVTNYDIKNTYNPETVDLEGTKTWVDGSDQDGTRPETINIDLVATVDGEEVYRTSQEVSGSNTEDSWTYKFEGMPKYANGKEITWTVEEEEVEGYEKTENALNVTNEHAPEEVSFIVTKTWDDADNQDGKRPESITVRLYADGSEVNAQSMSEANNWTYQFEHLPKYKDHGTAIVYTIKEDTVADYETTIESEEGSYEATITNTHETETVTMTIKKTWFDIDNKYGLRPKEITVDIYANGELFETVTITEKMNWEYVLEGIDKYANGEEIEYSIKEREIDKYYTTYDQYTINNHIKEDEIEIVPPNTSVISSNDASIIYYAFAVISMLSLAVKKVFE